jgi:Zn-dependent peptidase ImmA (M78 family)/DNA-binding XRE family transcriptional regulator
MNNILDEINPQELGSELKKAREKRGLTQQDASEILGVARTTLTAIEKGERRIKASELIQLAHAYGKTVGDFVRQERPKSMPFEPQFRAAYRSSKENEVIADDVVDEFEELCKDYVELENITNDKLEYRYPAEYKISGSRIEQQAESIAIQERQRLGLGDGPIPVLRTLFEREVGLRIFYMDLKPSQYAGLYVYDAVMGGCIAINRKHSLERRQWSLAHEYAHFLAQRQQVDLVQEDEYQRLPAGERFAEAFSKNFLMPVSSIGRQIGDKDIHRTDLFILARYFGVSVQAMTLRLEELRYIPTGTWNDLKQRGIKVRDVQERLGIEPILDADQKLPIRFQYLALKALQESEISEGLFAKYMRVSRAQARELAFALESTEIPLVDGVIMQPGDGNA